MIREIKEKDYQKFLEMEEKFYTSDACDTPYVKDYCIRTFQKLMDKKDNLLCYVFESEEKEIMGFALITSYWRNEIGGFVLILDELYVDEAFRGKKVGSTFLNFMMNELSDDYKMLTLEVSKNNERVKALYNSYGFTVDTYEHMIQK